jgi:aspartate racemase
MARHWRRVIGIVGGLGPHAHIEFERRLLAEVAGASCDQDYPEWLLSSIPGTPDRTLALAGSGPSPVPLLVRSLERLLGRADFAVVPCVTAHHFLPEVRLRIRLPILDLVEATLTGCADPAGGRLGLLATTGTIESGLFAGAARRVAPRLEVISLHDLPGGRELQEELVMRPIYGPLVAGGRRPGDGQPFSGGVGSGQGSDGRLDGRLGGGEGSDGRLGGGLKAGGERDVLTGRRHREVLVEAAERLAGAGATVIAAACTEVSIAFAAEGGSVAGRRLVDCMQAGVEAVLAVARGDLPLPVLPEPVAVPVEPIDLAVDAHRGKGIE